MAFYRTMTTAEAEQRAMQVTKVPLHSSSVPRKRLKPVVRAHEFTVEYQMHQGYGVETVGHDEAYAMRFAESLSIILKCHEC